MLLREHVKRLTSTSISKNLKIQAYIIRSIRPVVLHASCSREIKIKCIRKENVVNNMLGTTILEQENEVKDIMSNWMNFFKSRILCVKFRKVGWIWPNTRGPHAEDLNKGWQALKKFLTIESIAIMATRLCWTWRGKSGAWFTVEDSGDR